MGGANIFHPFADTDVDKQNLVGQSGRRGEKFKLLPLTVSRRLSLTYHIMLSIDGLSCRNENRVGARCGSENFISEGAADGL